MLYLIHSLLKLQNRIRHNIMLLENIFTRTFMCGVPILQSFKGFSMDFKCASMVESLLSEIFLNEGNVGISPEYIFKVGRT